MLQIKICGIIHPDDASIAAQLGADYIGMIFAPGFKRNVTHQVGKEIADAAREKGAEPVGVFVDATHEEILRCCELTGITTVQLHGQGSRKSLSHLHGDLFYAVADPYAFTPLPPHVTPLFDHGGGTGIPLDWTRFVPPQNIRWFLAGGLNPSNVRQAVHMLRPSGVDVSSGVEDKNTGRKNPTLIKAFIAEARQ